MSGVAIVYTLFGSAETAGRIARMIVEERLAACANILAPTTSIYEWKGSIEETAEIPVLLKTTVEGSDRLMARLAELHDYEVPAILSLPVEVSHIPYEQWVAGQVSK